jgi:hypothetical protein
VYLTVNIVCLIVSGDGRTPEILNFCAHNQPGGHWPDSEIRCVSKLCSSLPLAVLYEPIDEYDGNIHI